MIEVFITSDITKAANLPPRSGSSVRMIAPHSCSAANSRHKRDAQATLRIEEAAKRLSKKPLDGVEVLAWESIKNRGTHAENRHLGVGLRTVRLRRFAHRAHGEEEEAHMQKTAVTPRLHLRRGAGGAGGTPGS